MEDKNIKTVHLKGKNTRITIMLKYNEESKSHYYLIFTKKLTDFRMRQINKTESVFSVETFSALFEVGFTEFLHNPLIENKVLNREISKISPFKASRYLTPDLM